MRISSFNVAFAVASASRKLAFSSALRPAIAIAFDWLFNLSISLQHQLELLILLASLPAGTKARGLDDLPGFQVDLEAVVPDLESNEIAIRRARPQPGLQRSARREPGAFDAAIPATPFEPSVGFGMGPDPPAEIVEADVSFSKMMGQTFEFVGSKLAKIAASSRRP